MTWKACDGEARGSRMFNIVVIPLAHDHGVLLTKLSCDIALHQNSLRKWVKELSADVKPPLPEHVQKKS